MKQSKTAFRFAALAAAALYTLPAFAEEAEPASEGLPQLNPAHFPEQLFWLAVTFGLLYLCMHFVALPGVKKTQDGRAATIAADLAAAQKANEETKAVVAQYEKALADARAQAQASVNEMATQAAKENAAKQAAQSKQLADRLAETEAKIAAARDAAIRDVKATATSLAEAIIEKVSGGKAMARGDR
jgi:F-type H+-transporting ATPase subunit b